MFQHGATERLLIDGTRKRTRNVVLNSALTHLTLLCTVILRLEERNLFSIRLMETIEDYSRQLD